MTPSPPPDPVLASVRTTFRAVAASVVPEMAALDDEAWSRAEEVVEDSLARRPARLRRQLRVFLHVAEWWPVARYGRRLSTLPPGPRTRVLAALERAPILLVRRGFWGVRTLVFMAWYSLPEVREAMGYRADPRGRTAPGAARPGGADA